MRPAIGHGDVPGKTMSARNRGERPEARSRRPCLIRVQGVRRSADVAGAGAETHAMP